MRENRSKPAVKICGLTDPEQALSIATIGADAIGVIGVPGTPRFVAEPLRRNLFKTLEQNADDVKRVWVVADLADDSLDAALGGDGTPTVVQLHGGESPERCLALKQRYPQVDWWKALRLRSSKDLHSLERYAQSVDALLLDAWSPDQLGGTGHRLSLDGLGAIRLDLPWWLAGGISAEWIPELLSRVNPDGLDASSRLEDSPGRKNLQKVKDLIDAVQLNR
ncbi:phosphoribosylanthranilate isomerase [Synechococcus sp. KORDI-100]|uniref:phosphoribosylanthranilate isomerase n=1 Tax=Synechococcus sp. KORDI-100 TaxID=1280380 RepID=UPI000571150C|nr:phosphoribosylanthranilate isomerase [Synechococcus sp. KORDI-100]